MYKINSAAYNCFMSLFTVMVLVMFFKDTADNKQAGRKCTASYSSVAHGAADTQCGLAGSAKAFHHLASAYQRAGAFISSTAAKCLTH